MIRYTVDDHSPSVLYPPGYVISGWDSRQGICSPAIDPYNATKCANEEEAVKGMLANFRATWPACPHVEEGFEGSYAPDYASVRRTYGYGSISFSSALPGAANRKYNYTVWCPGWGNGNEPPSLRNFSLAKIQHFDCPAGFQPKHADNPAYVPGGLGLDWPLLCEPTMPAQAIYVYNITQTESAPGNCNPCFPATGDKARFEVDFQFAGKDFVRSYHSLGQIQISPELGVNWSHTYMGMLTTVYGTGRFTERGYLETYLSGRGDRASAEMLRKLPDGGFELIEASGSTRRFDAQRRLIAIGDPDPKNGVSLHYDANGRLRRAVDGLGRSLVFAYERGRLISITLPDGSAATYTYDDFDNLTGVVRPDGTSRQYLYAEPGLAPAAGRNLLTGIVEGGARYATFSYNEKAKVTGSHLWSAGQSVDAITINYNSDGSATTVNSLGEVRQNFIGGEKFRQITQTTDSKGSKSFGFTPNGRPSYTQDALGNRTSYAYADSSSGPVSQVLTTTEESLGRVTRTVRDSGNRVIEQRVSQKTAGNEQLVSLDREVLDASGRALYSCQYDATQGTDYVCGSLPVAPGNVRQTARAYCTDADVAANALLCPLVGLQRSIKDPAGNVTQFEFFAANDPGCDAGGACSHRKGDLRAIVNALGQRTELLEYDALGNPVQIRGIDGSVVERLFDSMGRVLTETLKGDVPANDRISLYEYSSTGKRTRVTGPDGVWVRMVYDTADRLVAIEDAAGNRVTYILDAAGNRVREEVRDSSGALKRFGDRQFDTHSQMTRQVGADGQPFLFRHDANGNVLETESPLGVVSKSTYDGADRPKVQIQDAGGINAEVRYAYSANGQVEQVVDPKGLATQYTYDGFGAPQGQLSPDTGSDGFTVDAMGNRTTRTDARGVKATYSYDVLNRLKSITYADPNLDVVYAYDAAPAVCPAGERFGEGRVGQVLHAGGSTAYCYDRSGQLVRKVQTVDGVGLTLRYSYTKAGRLERLTYPDGSITDYAYDNLGRASEVGLTLPGQARKVVVTNITYAPFGPMTGWAYGNGRHLLRELDADYRPSRVYDAAPGGLSIGFGYDADGNIVEVKDGTGTTTLARYGYDALGRLTQTRDGATGTPIETYAYDATGNRTALTTSAGTASYTYPATSHRLTAVDGEARSHDAAGNTTSIGSKAFTYSDANRMNAVKQGKAVLESYAYNHRGERVLRTPAGGAAQITLYDEAGKWLGNYSATGQAQQQAIWLENYPVALISMPATGVPDLAYVQPDHLGTPRVVIDPARDSAIWEWSSKSEVFGNQIPNADPDGDGVAFELALRFPGQQTTDANGLFYNYRRDYDSETGRYLQSDPIGLWGGLSTFSYVEGDPLSLVDPLGLRGGAPPNMNRHGGGNSAQRRQALRAQVRAVQSNSLSSPIYSRGLSPEDVGSLENAASLVSEHDYTQYCAVEICRASQDRCTSGDVMVGGFPSDPTVAQVHARGCSCASAYYTNPYPPLLSRPEVESADIIEIVRDTLINWKGRR
ncbi:RHS repeat-associated core domain-containing protein [Stenotrophomonas maltophilia]|uniref:RHS repeat-associated core domain-containing protein n=1 Tax=Stenotrophomonas TaxID=40323 RepID=UPI0021C63C68|nr:RHS repeat-associated core domain-containing protein [Stenotrophomonas maltophilia]